MNKISESINDYNELVPFIIKLEKQNYDASGRCSHDAGYGFTIYATKDVYVDICLWGGNSSVSVKRRTTKYYTDPVNDTELKNKNSIKELEEVKQTILEYLEYGKTLEKVYNVELTKTELDTIINLVDESLKNKLSKYLQ